MSDLRLRKLERAAATGDLDAARRLDRERVRHERPSQGRPAFLLRFPPGSRGAVGGALTRAVKAGFTDPDWVLARAVGERRWGAEAPALLEEIDAHREEALAAVEHYVLKQARERPEQAESIRRKAARLARELAEIEDAEGRPLRPWQKGALPPTRKQVSYLRSLGGGPIPLTRAGASLAIKRALARRRSWAR